MIVTAATALNAPFHAIVIAIWAAAPPAPLVATALTTPTSRAEAPTITSSSLRDIHADNAGVEKVVVLNAQYTESLGI